MRCETQTLLELFGVLPRLEALNWLKKKTEMRCHFRNLKWHYDRKNGNQIPDAGKGCVVELKVTMSFFFFRFLWWQQMGESYVSIKYDVTHYVLLGRFLQFTAQSSTTAAAARHSPGNAAWETSLAQFSRYVGWIKHAVFYSFNFPIVLCDTSIICWQQLMHIWFSFAGNNNGMNHYNFDGSGAGGSLPDTNFQSAASDFLSPLSQMSENLGGSNSNIQKAMTPGSADTQHHSNSQSSNGPGSIEGQPLRHPTPAPGTPGSATPSSQANLTNQSMSPACNSQPMGGGAASGASNQASTPNNHHPASNNSTGDNNTSNHSQLATHNDLGSDLNFDPEAIIEGEGQGQESLDVSLFSALNTPYSPFSFLFSPFLFKYLRTCRTLLIIVTDHVLGALAMNNT